MAIVSTNYYGSNNNTTSPRQDYSAQNAVNSSLKKLLWQAFNEEMQVNALVALASQAASLPLATTTSAGVVKEAADVVNLASVGPGTPAGTIVDVGAAFSQATLNNNFASVATTLNAVMTALKNAGLMA